MEAPLLILYGSQTGNAQDVAERVGREAARRHYRPRVMAADAYLPHAANLPAEPAVVFVASVCGQGELPNNMRRLWKLLLRKSLPADLLAGVTAGVFGLGDSGYPQYNVVAKKVYRRLEALGAVLAVPLGLGDDQHRSGYEAALDPWLQQLWPALRRRFPLPEGVAEPDPSDTAIELVCKFRVTHLTTEEAAAARAAAPHAPGSHEEEIAAARAFDAVEAAASGVPLEPESSSTGPSPRSTGGTAVAADGGHSAARPFFGRLLENRRLTAPDHFQDVRHLAIDLAGSGISYLPGDVLAIMPQQPEAAVADVMQRYGFSSDAWVRIEAAAQPAATGGPAPPAAVVRLGALVAGALDVGGASPRRLLFQVMAQRAGRGGSAPGSKEELEAERLAYFSTPEGRDDLYTYNQREGRTVAEVLADFPSAAPPLEWLLQAVPRLKPRYFSIASSLAAHPAQAQLAVAVVDWATPFKRRRRGVASSWLAGLDPGAGEVRLPVWAEPGALRLPPDPAVPLIMVGPGTGVAPFRAFLQERRALRQSGPAPTPCVLCFGCRNEGGDFLYREEWAALEAVGVLAQGGLITAFSRDQAAKVYVQHRIRERGADLWRLLEQGAWVYVAGSADKMPADVASAFEDVAVAHGGLGREEAAAAVRRLQLSRRYQVEAWS